MEAFPGRRDIFGTRAVRSNKACCVKQTITQSVYLDHLRGRQPLGIYPLVGDRVWFAAIDIDQPDPEPVIALARIARDIGLTPLIEKSKSKGFHLWFFSDEQGWFAERIRAVLRWMCREINRPEIEVFPKQDQIHKGQFGNFIYLPFNGRLVKEGRTIFVEPTRWMPPVSSQWGTLAHRPRYTAEHLNQIAAELELSGPSKRQPSSDRVSNAGEHASNRDALGIPSMQHGRDGFSLPPCAQRMLAEGVTEQQRVACFRLAVHLHRIGVPEDLARVLLEAWSDKNQPTGGKRVITVDEIANQTRDGYSGRYRGYGCDDPIIAQYCEGRCPVKKSQPQNTMRQSAKK